MSQTALTPKQIALILIPFITLLIGYFWLTSKANEGALPLILKPAANNTVSLPLSTGQIFQFNEHGQLQRQIDTRDLGIKNYHGDLAWINNNEVIVYGGYSGRTLADNLVSFTRTTPNESPSSQQGLWHCYIEEKQCEPFTHELNTMKHTFHLSYDPAYQHLYLANTNHHIVYRLNLKGELLSKTQDGALKFPNQLRIFANQLWVANTNQHKVSYFALGNDSLEASQGEITIDHLSPCLQRRHPIFDVLSEEPHCYPNSLAYVDKRIWLGVAKNNMQEAEIQIFSNTGDFIERLDMSQLKHNLNLTYEPDPISFVQLNNFVMFSDLNNRTIYRYDLSLKTWSALSIDALSPLLQQSFEHKQTYTYISYAVMAIFVLCILIGLSIGVKQQIAQTKESTAQANKIEPSPETPAALPQPPSNPFWFEKNKKIHHLLLFLGAISVVIIALGAYIVTGLKPTKQVEFAYHDMLFLVAFLNIIVLFTYVIYTQQSKKLGIAGRLLLVERKKGQTAIAPLEHSFLVNKRGILVEDVFFPLGTDQLKFLNKEQYKQYLKPRLTQLQTMNEWGYFKFRLANMNQEASVTLLLTIPLLITLFLIS